METVTIGDCTLYCGDSAEILPTLGMFDAIVTDPPYEFASAGGKLFGRDDYCLDKIRKTGLDKGFDCNLITSEQFCSAVVFCHNDQLAKLLPYFAEQYRRYALCCWHKSNPMPVANRNYKPDTEFYIHAWQKDAHPIGDLNTKSRYFIGSVMNQFEYNHPTIKPLQLMLKIIENVNGDNIVDPFMGTGTTGVACVKRGRKFTGIERERKYFDIACKRIEEADAQGDMFPHQIMATT